MSARRFLLLGLTTLISTHCFAAKETFACPSASVIHQAQYVGAYAPALFMYSVNSNFVFVSIPPTDANPNPSQAQAFALLQATTAPYPNSQGAPCFYAPNATELTSEKPFVMWSDQKPPKALRYFK